MKKNVFKIIWIVCFIIEVVVFIMVNTVLKKGADVFFSIHIVPLIIIEIINIVFGILLLLKKDNKVIHILFIIFIIILFFIPIYHIGNTFAPTGVGGRLMGIGLHERLLNVYGINIIKLFR